MRRAKAHQGQRENGTLPAGCPSASVADARVTGAFAFPARGDATGQLSGTAHDVRLDWSTLRAAIHDVEIGARTVSVCHLVNLAYYHGQHLKWNPSREKFTGGTGNAKWLDVSYRDPWKLA